MSISFQITSSTRDDVTALVFRFYIQTYNKTARFNILFDDTRYEYTFGNASLVNKTKLYRVHDNNFGKISGYPNHVSVFARKDRVNFTKQESFITEIVNSCGVFLFGRDGKFKEIRYD